jgi:hypothetical protein
MVNVINNVITNFKANIDNSMKAVRETFMSNEKFIKSSTGRLKTFRAESLSLLFMFIGLKSIIDSFFKSAITTFQKANEDIQGLGKATWELQGAWEFFKYSLIDALVQSDIFQIFVKILLEIVMWFNKLSPKTKLFIILGTLIFSVALIVGILISQFMLLAGSMGITLASSILYVGILVLGLMLIIGGIIALIYFVVKAWQSWKSGDIDSVIKYVSYALIALGVIIIGIALLIGSWPLAMIAAGIILVAIVIRYWREIVSFLLKTLSVISAGIINIFTFVWNSIVDLFNKVFVQGIISGMRFVVDTILSAIRLLLDSFSKLPFVGGLVSSALKSVDSIAKRVNSTFDSMSSSANNIAGSLKAGYVSMDDIKNQWGDIDTVLKTNVDKSVPSSSEIQSLSPDSSGKNSSNSDIFNINNYIDAKSYTPEQLKKIVTQGISDDLNLMIDSVNN